MTGPTSGGSATRATAGGRIKIPSGAAGASDVRAAQLALIRANLQQGLRANRIRRRVWMLIGAFWGIVGWHVLVWLGS
jgi:hypothetical protein